MSETVRDYIDKEKEQRKRELAFSLGLFEEVYKGKNDDIKDFNFSKWNKDGSEMLYYNKIPLRMSDEEYEELKKYCELTKTSAITKALNVLGIIIIVIGFITGIALGNRKVGYDETEFVFSIFLVYSLSGLISGLLMMGVGKIIELLEDIKRK